MPAPMSFAPPIPPVTAAPIATAPTAGRVNLAGANLAGAKLAGATPDRASVEKAARDFEAMAIGQLLAPMFQTVDTAHSLFGGGSGEETWKPMLVAEFGKHIAAHGGFGLAAPIAAAMLRMQEAQPPEPRKPRP